MHVVNMKQPQTRELLNERQARVLKLVCDTFITTGEPVGSRTLAKMQDLPCSPATIRNEMADLEEIGLLMSPHTSAGRIPTETGFCFYVNFLMHLERLTQREEAIISMLAQRFEEEDRQQSGVLKNALRLVSDLNRLPAVLITPRQRERRLRTIRLVKMSEQQLLLALADNAGRVVDALIPLRDDMSTADVEALNRFLEEQLCNRNLSDIDDSGALRRGEELLHRFNRVLRTITLRIKQAFAHPDADNLFLDGVIKFFEQPEFLDPNRIRSIVELVESKERLLTVLAQRIENDDVRVAIGSQSGFDTDQLSLVTAPYAGPNGSAGCIGLIGPIRMNYGRVISSLTEISRRLSEILSSTPLTKFEMRK